MNKIIINIRGCHLGEGIPKICIPLSSSDHEGLIREIDTAMRVPMDLVEWRADSLLGSGDKDLVLKELPLIREAVGDKPILFTVRTSKEGSSLDISDTDYQGMCTAVIECGCVDLIDIELSKGDDICRELIDKAAKHNVVSVVSSHDFETTPKAEVLISRFCHMQELGGDIPKIAVMPTCSRDVLTLMEASCIFNEEYAKGPFISMSMGGMGAITRVGGYLTGTCLTFAVGEKPSAPGQIGAGDVKRFLEAF